MKFLLLKALLLPKRKDEGFTLPIVIAIGLVMVLLSTVNLVQSGEENLNALSQQGSSNALAAAELGVARYRDLLINNRVLAVNNSDEWTDSLIVGDSSATPPVLPQVCTNTTEIVSWADTSDTGWRDINVGGDNIGSYRLVQYEYDRDGIFGDNNRNGILDDLEGGNTNDNGVFSQLADDGDLDNDNIVETPFNPATNNHNDINNDATSDAVGLLTIQGRDDIGSIAQLQVTIPLGVNTQDLTDLNPALWVGQTNISNIGDIDMDSDDDGTPSELIANGDDNNDGNIVLRKPATSGSNGCDDPPNLAGENTISDPRSLPPIVDQTAINSLSQKRTIRGTIRNETYGSSTPRDPANFFNTTTGEIVLGTRYDNTTGGSGDPTNSTQALNPGIGVNGGDIYYYTTGTSDLVLNDGDAIIGDIGNRNSRVILHVGRNLRITTGANGVRLVNASHISETGSTTPRGIARFLEIHVEGDVFINGNLNETVDITGLLRVGGTVNITGSPTVNVIGSIWANDWNASNSANINIDTDQTIANGQLVSEYNFYSITPNRTPAPITYRPSGWEKQEVTN